LEKNKLYKTILFVLCIVLVVAQLVCFSLGIMVEINAIIDAVAIVISFFIVVVLKKKHGINKTKEEIKNDIISGVDEIKEIIDKVQDKFDKKEWFMSLFFCCIKFICNFNKFVYNYINSKKTSVFYILENRNYDV